MPTSTLAIVLTVVSTMVSAVGSIAFKKSAKKLSLNLKAILKNYKLILGFFLFGLSAIIYVFALTQGELNVLYPISAMTYVWSLFIGKYYFGEKLNSYKLIGMLLIVMGAIFIPK